MKKGGRRREEEDGGSEREEEGRESCFVLPELNDSRVDRAGAYEFVCIPRILDPFMEVEAYAANW